MEKVLPHDHGGTNSPKLYAGDALEGAPQEALTVASDPNTLTTGGANNLKTADALILQNALTRLNELETKLQALGIIK